MSMQNGQFSCLQRLLGDSLYPASSPIKNKAHLKMSTHSKSQVTKALLLVQTEQGTWDQKRKRPAQKQCPIRTVARAASLQGWKLCSCRAREHWGLGRAGRGTWGIKSPSQASYLPSQVVDTNGVWYVYLTLAKAPQILAYTSEAVTSVSTFLPGVSHSSRGFQVINSCHSYPFCPMEEAVSGFTLGEHGNGKKQVGI